MIDLLVVNYNSSSYLDRWIHDLWYSVKGPRNWRIYLADNGSTDQSKAWLNAHEDLFDKVWYNDNIGYAKAINQMAAATSSDILAACNADIAMTDSNLKEIEQAFIDNPNIAVLGPKQRSYNGLITHAGIFGTLEAPKHRAFRSPDPTDTLYRDMLPVVTVSGAAYFTRRDVWNQLTECPLYKQVTPEAKGAFLETFHYWDETYYSYHCHAHAHEVWYWGPVSIIHDWHGSSTIGSEVDQAGNIIKSKTLFQHACDVHGIPHD